MTRVSSLEANKYPKESSVAVQGQESPVINVVAQPQIRSFVPCRGRIADGLRELKMDDIHRFDAVPTHFFDLVKLRGVLC